MTRLLSFALLLAGCVYEEPWGPPGNIPPARLQSALQRWTGHGLPVGYCDRIGDDTSIYVGLTRDELNTECPSPDVLGCSYAVASAGRITHRYVFVREGQRARVERTIEHELRHLFAKCSGLRDDVDPKHVDVRLWFEPMDEPDHHEYERYELPTRESHAGEVERGAALPVVR